MARFLVVTLALLLIVGVFWVFEDDLPADTVDARYANDASRFLTAAAGARLHYRDQGPRDTLPVVLIHGANASLHTWEPWVDELASAYRIVTLDLPGHGLTGQVPDGDYRAQSMVDAVHAVVAALDLGSFVIGGSSMGGGVAWRYALAHPDRVRALILVDASPPRDWSQPESASGERAADEGDTPAVFRLLQQPWFRKVARYLDPGLFVTQGLEAAVHDDAVVDEAMIERYRDLALREGSRLAILRQAAQSAGAPPEPAADLSSLEQPALILWGAHDTLIPPRVGEWFQRTLPNAQLTVYEDLGHLPMREAPERTAEAVRRFLRTLPASP